MVNVSNTPDNLNHLREKNWKGQLTVSRIPSINFFLTGVTMPSFSVGEIPRRGINKLIPEPSNTMEKDPLTVQFLVDEDLKNWLEVYEWMLGMSFPESFAKSKEWIASQEGAIGESHPYKSQLKIVTLKNSMKANKVFIFHNAFPISLEGFDFTAQTTDDPVITSLTFTYSHMTVENL